LSHEYPDINSTNWTAFFWASMDSCGKLEWVFSDQTEPNTPTLWT
jgi:hypothetical protein